MNKFEQIDGQWYWRGNAGLIEAEDQGIIHRDDFLDFIANEDNFLREKFFEFSSCNAVYQNDMGELYVPYNSTLIHAIDACIKINMRGGDKLIFYEIDQLLRSYSEYDEWGYFNACDKISAAEARAEIFAVENAQLGAENARLREENTELRYRPGSLGYDEAEEHFAALALE